MKKIFFAILLVVVVQCFVRAQNGSIQGIIADTETHETLPNASVYVEISGENFGAISDLDGFFSLKPLTPGLYNLFLSYTGYGKKVITRLNVKPDKALMLDTIYLSPGVSIKGITIEASRQRMVDPQEPSKMTFLPSQLEQMPNNKSITGLIRNLSTDIKIDEQSNQLIIRGSRPGSSAYFIDGVKSESMENLLPSTAIGSITMYTGGIPAKYGDLTGGVIVVETKSYFDLLNDWKAFQMQKKYEEEEKNE